MRRAIGRNDAARMYRIAAAQRPSALAVDRFARPPATAGDSHQFPRHARLRSTTDSLWRRGVNAVHETSGCPRFAYDHRAILDTAIFQGMD